MGVRRPRTAYVPPLLVILAGVAVAHRRLGPNSSAATSTVERALPSSAVQSPLLEPADDQAAAPLMTFHFMQDRLKASGSVSTESAVAVTRSDLLTIC